MLLYHFSEEKDITVFEPRPSRIDQTPMVWAIDAEHAALYYFPRNCPRAAFGPGKGTSAEDLASYHSVTKARRVILIEHCWLQQVLETKLYAYHFAPEPFRIQDKTAGYYVSLESVIPLKVEPMGNLIAKLAEADVELRLTPSLTPIRESVIHQTYDFSLIRMAYASV
jgi:hypothetical protein